MPIYRVTIHTLDITIAQLKALIDQLVAANLEVRQLARAD